MKKLQLLVIIYTLIYFKGYSQDPYIMDGPGEGLGQYGYIEKDATTFARLNRGGHTNINQLATRWWVGQEYIYYTNNGSEGAWNCNNSITSRTTENFSSSHFGSNWTAGASAYVSVYAYYGCPQTNQSHYPSNTGFNERQFHIFDFETVSTTTTSVTDTDNNCTANNVVSSFTLDFGTLTGKTLERFFFKNNGSLQETTHIPNDGFKLFYELATGSESFDGSESSANLYGDWNSSSTNNNEYGAEGMNIPVNTKTRFYVVLCDLINGIDPSGHTNAVSLELLNDGMSFGPSVDAHNLARISSTSLGGSKALPVVLISFEAKTINENKAVLNWSTASETNNSHFEVERSVDARDFETIGSVTGKGTTQATQQYTFYDEAPFRGLNYYRLKQVDYDGQFSHSIIRSIKIQDIDVKVVPNPSSDFLEIRGLNNGKQLEIIDLSGKVIYRKNIENTSELHVQSSNFSKGIFVVRVLYNDNTTFTTKISVN